MKNFQDRLEGLTSDVKDLWGRAYRESLTGLLNRPALDDVLLTQLNALDSTPPIPFALLYMDLNGFKAVNDTLGHNAGDLLLKQVAQRLQSLHPERAFRDGGDEFAVVLPHCTDVETALRNAELIRGELAKPYDLEGKPAHVAASIGVVFCADKSPLPSSSTEDDFVAVRAIRDEGDRAMYWAKRLSKTSLRMFAPNSSRPLYGGCRLSSEPTPPDFRFPVYKKVLREGYGKGRVLRIDKIETCEFRVLQYSDGGIELFAEYPPTPEFIIRTTGGSHVSFEGIVPEIGTSNACEITSQTMVHVGGQGYSTRERGYIRSESFILNDLKLRFKNALVGSIRFYLTNFHFPTEPRDHVGPLNIQVGKFLFVIHPYGDREQQWETIQRLRQTHETEVTCYCEVKIASSTDADGAVGALNQVLKLLTLFQGSRINWLAYDYLAEDGELIQSVCRNSPSGALASINGSGLWTIPFLEATIPILYDHFPEVEREWNLTKVMAFFAQCSLPNEAWELEAGKIIYCIELLVHAYLEQTQGDEERENSLDRREFADALQQMCQHLNVKGLQDSSGRLREAVDLVAVFRLRLRREATLVGGSFDDYHSTPARREFESSRRVAFLREFAGVCIEAILNPEGDHEIGTGEMADAYDDLGIQIDAV